MDTSKTRSIKSLLLQAWRERWSDITWGIRIKTVLPRGVSGDVYDLAECILQQALVGPGPNTLFMGYLVHSLSSRVVSYGAVLSSIGRYQNFSKPYCILSLLDLLKSFQSRIGCHGNEEECIALCKAVVSVTHWLYCCVLDSITKLAELKNSSVHASIMEKSYEALFYFSCSTFIKSLIYVGKFEDTEMYTQMLQKQKDLESKMNPNSSIINVTKETIECALGLVSSVDNLPSVPLEKIAHDNKRLQLITSTLNVMICIDAVLNPANDIGAFVGQLLLVSKLQSLTLSQLYCEIIRSSFIGHADSGGTTEELKWAAFSFLKIPILISRIQSIHKSTDDNALYEGLNILLQFTPLLDSTDVKTNSDCFQFLTSELCKAKLLSEVQVQELTSRRRNETQKINFPRPQHQGGQAYALLILRAEKTVLSILKSLDSDYSKIQEPLLKVLCQMVPGKNFELILSAAAATGKLQLFVSKLIQFNEYHKHSVETNKTSQSRALLFDITFLMLTHIAQHFGIEIVTANPDLKDTFFYLFASECLSEGGKFKCPDIMLARSNPENVDTVLVQIVNTEQDMDTSQVKWDEICINTSAAVKEIVVAWEHGNLLTEKVKTYLDHIKSQMCCLPVCTSAWLCNYINILHHEERLKPINMLQHFSTPLALESSSPTESPTMQVQGADNSQFYKERSTLMISIIKKMMYDLHPPPQTKPELAPVVSHGLTVHEPLGKIIDEVFKRVHLRGWTDLKSIHYFDTLMCVGGPRWLCKRLVLKIFSFQYARDINRAVDLALGLFYMDIEECALELLTHVLPFYLYSEKQQERLAEPYGTAIARLTVIATYQALESKRNAALAGLKSGRKRTHRDINIESSYEEHNRPSKMHRSDTELLEDTPFHLQSSSEEHLRSAISNPINKAVTNLMRTLHFIASDATISPRSMFPIRFLEQVVLCAKDQASAMLQFMPLGLVTMLLKSFPEEFTHELILAVSSMQSPRARKVAALGLCQLTIAQNRLNGKDECWLGLSYQSEH